MKLYKVLSFILAVLLTIPLLLIPEHMGLSLPEGKIENGGDKVFPNNSIKSLYYFLDAYYIFFVISSILPFLFLVIWSSYIIRIQRKRNGKSLYSGKSNGKRKELYPKVSIIIPCYNESKHVGAAIEHSYKQLYPGDIEIIVVDDGSRDNTWSISKIFSSNKGNRAIKVIHKENGGKASALRVGVKESSGDIIIMTDGDGQIALNAVAEIVRTFHEHPDAAIVGGFVTIKNSHMSYLTKLQQLEYIVTQHVIRMSQSDSGSVLIAPGPIFGMKSDIARKFPPLDRTVVEDCDLTMSVLSTGLTTRATINSISYTDAPTNWNGWIKQRKRWIYGQFQAWRENRWHLKRNPWGLYTYFTWVSTSFSALIFLLFTFITLILTIQNWYFYSFLKFISIRTLLILGVYFFSRGAILLSYPQTRRLLHYLPLKIFYDMVNSFLTAYLYFRYITSIGIKLKWGHRVEVIR